MPLILCPSTLDTAVCWSAGLSLGPAEMVEGMVQVLLISWSPVPHTVSSWRRELSTVLPTAAAVRCLEPLEPDVPREKTTHNNET